MAYEYDRDNGGGAFLMGLLAGTVLGAGLGMLLAPKAGAELRNDLSESANRFQRAASETYQQASSKVSQMVERGREAYDEMVDKGREAYEQVRGTATEASDEASQRYSSPIPSRPGTSEFPS